MRELVLFDFDGTLARTLPAVVECYRHAFAEVLGERFPGEDPADLERVLTVRFTDVCEQAAGERAPLLVESFRERYRGELEAPVALYDGAREALEALAGRGVAVAIVTNKTRFALDLDLERTGLAEVPFAALVAADDSVESKPHPRPLLLACERAGVASTGCFYVGDAPHDIAAARAAGMHGVAALWGDFPAAALREAEPWALAAEPAALPDLLVPRPTTVSNRPG
jgi:pyrophosphatase PpaX